MTRLLLTSCLLLLLTAPSACSQPRQTAGVLADVFVGNGATAWVGDSRRVTTISPNGDGFRDAALLRFRLSAPARVHVEIARTPPAPRIVVARTVDAGAGVNTFRWAPPANVPPRTYVVRMTIAGHRYGAWRHLDASRPDNVVVRVQGVDAAFGAASYRAGTIARLAVATDADELTFQLFRVDDRPVTTHRNDVMQGTPVTRAWTVDWDSAATRPRAVDVRIGDWPSGVYFARVTASDGRVGYAPLVVTPRLFGTHRVAIVLPTNTWQAYNFYDRDGDGWGDTWYAAWNQHRTRLGRPFQNRGVPPHFRAYDLAFLRWLDKHDVDADFLADNDVETLSGDRLARAYDFVVFPGHHEYVTAREYANVRRYRDLGGNLAWLSANNFFWKVVRHGAELERVAQWRTLGLPEASLIGVQYRGNDEGERRAPYTVANVDAAPWLFRGTGLQNGSQLGPTFGIEIDSVARSSPRGTTVLAAIPDLYGPGFTAQMTYYETAAGAKVFAAGAFTLAGKASDAGVSRLLANLFEQLSRP